MVTKFGKLIVALVIVFTLLGNTISVSAQTSFTWPVPGREKFNSFGFGSDTADVDAGFHTGFDITGLEDTEIVSPCDGAISFNGNWPYREVYRSWLDTIVVSCSSGGWFSFTHTKGRIDEGVSVKAGDLIAKIGPQDYNSTEPNVHVMFFVDDPNKLTSRQVEYVSWWFGDAYAVLMGQPVTLISGAGTTQAWDGHFGVPLPVSPPSLSSEEGSVVTPVVYEFSLERGNQDYTDNMIGILGEVARGRENSWTIPAGGSDTFISRIGPGSLECPEFYKSVQTPQMSEPICAAGACDVASMFCHVAIENGLGCSGEHYNELKGYHPFVPGIDDESHRIWIWDPGRDATFTNPFGHDVTFHWVTDENVVRMWIGGTTAVSISSDGGNTESQTKSQNFLATMEVKDWVIVALAATILILLVVLFLKKPSSGNIVIVLDDRHVRWDPFDLSKERWWYNTIKGSLTLVPWMTVMIFYLLVSLEVRNGLSQWLEARGVTWYGSLVLLVGLVVYWYVRNLGYWIYPQKNGDLEVRKHSIPRWVVPVVGAVLLVAVVGAVLFKAPVAVKVAVAPTPIPTVELPDVPVVEYTTPFTNTLFAGVYGKLNGWGTIGQSSTVSEAVQEAHKYALEVGQWYTGTVVPVVNMRLDPYNGADVQELVDVCGTGRCVALIDLAGGVDIAQAITTYTVNDRVWFDVDLEWLSGVSAATLNGYAAAYNQIRVDHKWAGLGVFAFYDFRSYPQVGDPQNIVWSYESGGTLVIPIFDGFCGSTSCKEAKWDLAQQMYSNYPGHEARGMMEFIRRYGCGSQYGDCGFTTEELYELKPLLLLSQ